MIHIRGKGDTEKKTRVTGKRLVSEISLQELTASLEGDRTLVPVSSHLLLHPPLGKDPGDSVGGGCQGSSLASYAPN